MNNQVYERIALVLVSIGAVAVLVNMVLSEPALRGPDAAAWVQAIGSIAAIFAAIQIARNQDKRSVEREERRSRANVLQLQEMLYSVLRQAAHLINAMPVEYDNRQQLVTYLQQHSSRAQFVEVERILREAPLYESGDSRIVSIVVQAGDCIDRAKRMHEHAVKYIGSDELTAQWDHLVHKILGEKDAINSLENFLGHIVHGNDLKRM